MYRVFIKYCDFSKDFIIIRTLALLCFPLVCVYTYQAEVEHQRCSRTGRAQKKSQHFKEKTQYLMNTLYITTLKKDVAMIHNHADAGVPPTHERLCG